MSTTLTTEQQELLKKCDGVHATLPDLFDCSSCNLLLEMDTQA